MRRQFPDSETKSQKSGAAPDAAHKDIRDKLRRLLPSNIFVQILAGPPELRTGIFGFLLKLIALTTLVALPILLLLLLQIQFLPFHDVDITNSQRIALFLDIMLLWLLQPPILADLSVESSGRARVRARSLRGVGLVVACVMSILAIWFSIKVATIPGEWQEMAFAPSGVVRVLLFAGEVDPITRRRKSLFSNTLVLPGFNLYEALKVDDPKKLAWKEHFFDLRGRHLGKAVLDGADLTKADLYGAWLQGATLDGARLQGASLDEAHLQGASLYGAQLQGAALVGAELQGASLDSAQLQGASLQRAQLQGASLAQAQLQGASLFGAHLQGASLEKANLQGALLINADLQGASLYDAPNRATDVSDAILWRAQWGNINSPDLGVVQLDVDLESWKPVWRKQMFSAPLPWDPRAYEDLRDSMNSIPEGKMRDDALKRIAILDCGNPDKKLASCNPDDKPPPKVAAWQKKLAAAGVDEAAFAKPLAKELQSLVCASDSNAIYILRGIRLAFALEGREAPALVDFIMSKDCPVSTSLTDDDKAKLLQIKQDAEQNSAPPPPSKKKN